MSIVLDSMATQMTTQDAAQHFRVSEKTIRRWIKSGKLQADLIDGRYHVHLDGQPDSPNVYPDVHLHDQTELIEQLRSEIQHLREQLQVKDEQINHCQQLLGMAEKNVAVLSEQLADSRRLIEDMRQPWWRQVFRRNDT